jgi:hypothetical protein
MESSGGSAPHTTDAPKGPKHTSPGQRPGEWNLEQPLALNGRYKSPRGPPRFVCGFEGLASRITNGLPENERVCRALAGLGREPATLFPGRCPGLVCYSPCGARSRCFGDRLIRMDQNPLANSITFGACENRMILILSQRNRGALPTLAGVLQPRPLRAANKLGPHAAPSTIPRARKATGSFCD